MIKIDKNTVSAVLSVNVSPKYNQVSIGNVSIDVANPMNRTGHNVPNPS